MDVAGWTKDSGRTVTWREGVSQPLVVDRSTWEIGKRQPNANETIKLPSFRFDTIRVKLVHNYQTIFDLKMNIIKIWLDSFLFMNF